MDIINFYGENLGIKELLYKDFSIEKKKKRKKIRMNNSYFGKKNGFIIFYSNFCEACEKSIEKWSNIAINYLFQFPIAAVNCQNVKDKNDLLIPLLKISHYPTIKYVSNNRIIDIDIDYKKEENIIFFINNNISQ